MIAHAERIAKAKYDGHLTIYRFTTGWKAFFGTPDITDSDYERIFETEMSETLEEAIVSLLVREAIS